MRYINKIRRVCLISVCTNPSREAQRFAKDIPDDLAQAVRLKDNKEHQWVYIPHHVSRDQLACHIAVLGFDISSPTLENRISGDHQEIATYSDIRCIANNPKASPIPFPIGGASGKSVGLVWCAYASTKNWRRALVISGEVVASASVRAYFGQIPPSRGGE